MVDAAVIFNSLIWLYVLESTIGFMLRHRVASIFTPPLKILLEQKNKYIKNHKCPQYKLKRTTLRMRTMQTHFNKLSSFRIIFLSLLITLIGVGCGGGGSGSPAPAPATNTFITTWKTDNPGSSANNQITINAFGGSNFTINWGDGTSDNNVTSNITHTYAAPGTYTVSISGAFPRFTAGGDASKLLSVEQWGGQEWQSIQDAFQGCDNLVINAPDNPNLSQVTNMSRMFQNAAAFNQDIGNWNVATVADMGSMFLGAALSTTNYDALLLGWSGQALQNNVFFSAGNTQYSASSQNARDVLVNTYGWTVSDGGVAP